MSTEPIAYRNGEFVPYSQLAIQPHDAGFVWGATVTDRVRTFAGNYFELDAHIRRFRQSCVSLQIPQPIADHELCRAADELLRRQSGSGDWSLVMFATPGELAGFSPQAVSNAPTIGLYLLPFDGARYRQTVCTGAILEPVHAPLGIDPAIKHRSRLAWWIASQKLKATHPEADPIWIEQGRVTETAAANLLAVLKGVVVSPPAEAILPGISLRVTREICTEIGIPFEYRPLPLDELRRASELILTCTSYGIAGVSRLSEHVYPIAGPIYRQLLEGWNQRVGINIHQGIGVNS